jgi:hypothetical protein
MPPPCPARRRESTTPAMEAMVPRSIQSCPQLGIGIHFRAASQSISSRLITCATTPDHPHYILSILLRPLKTSMPFASRTAGLVPFLHATAARQLCPHLSPRSHQSAHAKGPLVLSKLQVDQENIVSSYITVLAPLPTLPVTSLSVNPRHQYPSFSSLAKCSSTRSECTSQNASLYPKMYMLGHKRPTQAAKKPRFQLVLGGNKEGNPLP